MTREWEQRRLPQSKAPANRTLIQRRAFQSEPNEANETSRSHSESHFQPDLATVPIRSTRPMENRTGMPDQLKAGLENLSGLDLSAVQVHRNSTKPAQLGALAYAQGQDIHLGTGQEAHLPHEGWHVVQQMQGRVSAMRQNKGLVNDDPTLEREADVMGTKALQMRHSRAPKQRKDAGRSVILPSAAIQLQKILNFRISKKKVAVDLDDGEAVYSIVEKLFDSNHSKTAWGVINAWVNHQQDQIEKTLSTSGNSTQDLNGRLSAGKHKKDMLMTTQTGISTDHEAMEMKSYVLYTAAELEKRRVVANAYGRACWAGTKELINTKDNTEDKEWMYVIDMHGNLYVDARVKDEVYHSSLTGDLWPVSAGVIVVKDGFIKRLDNSSGHFMPGFDRVKLAYDELKEQGFEIGKTRFSQFKREGTEKLDAKKDLKKVLLASLLAKMTAMAYRKKQQEAKKLSENK